MATSVAGAKVSRVEHPSEREVIFTRSFDAPREILWTAWSDPVHLHRWFGPTGFTTTTHEFSFVPGGAWRFVMHSPEGWDNPNVIVFREIEPPSRLVYDNRWDLADAPLDFRVAVTLVAEGPRATSLSIHFTFASADDLRTATEVYGVIQGGIQTLERIAEYVA